VYRAALTLPAAWKGQRVYVSLASWDTPIFLGNATAYINGQKLGIASVGSPPNTVLDLTPYLHDGVNDLAFLVEAKVARGGFFGTIFLYAQPDLREAKALTAWALFKDAKQSTPVTLPVKVKARHLETSVDVPATWDAKSVYLDVDLGMNRWLKFIVVNDRVIGFNWYTHPFPNRVRLNLYPWIKPGAPNRIELWMHPDAPISDLEVQRATLGTL
ncbi:MAG TPA: hypothetical protein VGM23_00710, partial [Armatimonadota bacterium]